MTAKKKKPAKKKGARPEPGLLCHKDKKRGDRAFMILNGKRVYLGKFGTEEAQVEYERIKGKWLANDRQWPIPSENDSALAVIIIVKRYWDHAQAYYQHEGKPTGEAERNVFYALRPMLALYGDGKTLVSEFGPPDLELVRNRMVESGLSRNVVNQRVGIIRRMFRWAESKGIAPKGTFHNLATLEPLKAGRSEAGRSAARETERVLPAEWHDVTATIEHLTPTMEAMVRIQWETAMRPGEVLRMRACDIDRTNAEEWVYAPAQHKTAHHGTVRMIPLHSRSQRHLRPYLEDIEVGKDPSRYLFAPEGHTARHDHYSTTHYNQAIRRGIAAANAPARHAAVLAAMLPLVPEDARERLSKAVQRIVTNFGMKRVANAIEKQAERCGFDSAPVVAAATQALENHEDTVASWSPNQLRHAAATRFERSFGASDTGIIMGHAKGSRVTEGYIVPDRQRAFDNARKENDRLEELDESA